MDDTYQYPVFFECHSLLEEQKKTIQNYFCIRGKSNGGECGPLRTVNDKVYSIAFRHQKAQQRVLQKSKHVVELAEDSLVFTVQDKVEPHTVTTPTRQDNVTPAQSPRSLPALTPSLSDEEYELQPDTYLLHYLNECPKAWDDLQKELTTVACSAQIYPEEGRVLVRSLAQHAAEDEVRNWKSEVDKLFNGYMCYYEVDTHKVKALLQSCSHQTTDEVKVYSETGMAVVVGKCSEVNGILMDLQNLTFKRQSSSLREKQTSICSLGEGKLRLLWKDINHSLERDFPEVKVSQGDAGQIVLEGPVEDILGALDCISDKKKLVLERTVSNMSPHFMAFLRKAYGGPRMLRDFLGIGDEVEVELRDTELRFFSLSAHKLDDAEKTLQGEFKEVKLDVPNCFAVLPELQEKLKSKTNEMNQGQCRVQVVFMSDSTVCLLGHTKEVEELSETVTQVRDRLGPFLDSLVQDDDSGAVGYSTYKDTFPSVGNSQPHCQYHTTIQACDRLHQGMNTGNLTPRNLGIHSAAVAQDAARGATAGANGSGVHLEISEGTIETQQVDAIVSPMVGHNPLSTRVGNSLFNIVGRQLIARFRKEAEDESIPGDKVLVDGLSGLPFNAAFFLNLIPWDEDEDGTAVQVLRLGINNVLASCEHRGFRSIALPVLGSGIALCFPDHVVARVLLEEIHEFKRSRVSTTPFLVRVIIHPDDKETSEVFELVQEAFTKDINQPNQESTTKKIVLLGKTGSGKSSLANTLFGENLFTTNHSPNSGTKECQTETRLVNGRSITLIDTPGLFDTGRSEEEMKREILSCIAECSPGPHAFLIVLKVDKFTEQEKDIVTKICEYFSEEALKYAAVVFTHGEQLPKGMKIEDFVSQNKDLSDLVQKCGGRCHVFDNENWKNTQQKNYRSNQFQVEELLNTIDKMVMENNGGYYTNKVLQVVGEKIKKVEEYIKLSSGNMSSEETKKQAKTSVLHTFLIQLTGIGAGVLLGAFFGVEMMVRSVFAAMKKSDLMKLKAATATATATVAAAVGDVALTAGVVVGVATAAAAVTGGVMGGVIGNQAAEGAETMQEAAGRTYKAVMDKRNEALRNIK